MKLILNHSRKSMSLSRRSCMHSEQLLRSPIRKLLNASAASCASRTRFSVSSHPSIKSSQGSPDDLLA
ncbi:hypothetical protein RHECNPAF_770031 [Rhizobium etli CNPAF512]|nr:hypothetical protein RHECNPAF_770031 [Rhizobium etli CNPAF512]